jgi:hypothetical protein
MKGSIMTNGKNEDYAELVVTACNGDFTKLTYDEPAFRDSRALANTAMATLSMVGLAGHPIGEYQTGDSAKFFTDLPPWAHLIRVEINKLNHQSDKIKPYSQREYTCQHIQEDEPA